MTAVPLARPWARDSVVRRWLERECLFVVGLSVAMATVSLMLPQAVSQDTWLAFVDGRWISQHGLPHTDAITVLSHGASWIDQQWLAQLALYELERAGGMTLVLVAGFVVDFLALVVCALAARRAGASSRSVGCAMLAAILAAPWMMESRTQSFSVPLFALLYVLLASDSRNPSRRVWLVLPLLALWGNLHGTVVLGAGLVGVYALLTWRRGPLRASFLALGAVAMPMLTPYALQTPRYYERMFISSPMHKYVREWQPLSLTALTAGLMLLIFGVVAMLSRKPRAVSLFERVALLLLVAGAMLAIRNAIWFALAVAASGPALLDAVWPAQPAGSDRQRAFNLRLASGTLAVGALLTLVGFVRAPALLARAWPARGAAAVADAARGGGLVFGDDRHSDWLLWTEPQLMGRVAYDVRFELLTGRQLASLQSYDESDRPAAVTRGYRVVLFSTRAAAKPYLVGEARVAYAGPGLVAVSR